MSAANKELLTMERNGEFHVWAYGPNHCGADENLTVKYKMTCYCTARTDKRGFLFDQINVDNFFKSISKTKLSCEKLTVTSVKKLIDMIHNENPTCEILQMDLTLSPQPYAASMTYSWTAKGATHINSR